MNPDASRHRLGLLAVAAISLFGALFARLWFLQIVEGETLAAQATANQRREVIIQAPRGRVLDRNGLELVRNRESIVLAIDWAAFRRLEKQEQNRLLERVSASHNRWVPPTDQISPTFVRKRMNDRRFSPYRPIPIASDLKIDEEIYFREQARRFPAIRVEHQTVRSYPYGSLAAHVLGWVGALTESDYERLKDRPGAKRYGQKDDIGKSGIEKTYESLLRGVPGRRVYEVDRANNPVREITSLRRDPVPGDDVYLSIDARIQYKTEEALQARILASKSPTPRGAAVVLDPRDGGVLAMASYPTYDPSSLVDGIDKQEWERLQAKPDKVISNRAVQEAYPAGSTFKLATSYAGLKLGLIGPDTEVNDTGTYRVGCAGDGPGCLKKNSGGAKAMGPITLSTALTRSSDVYYYKLGVEAWRAHQAGTMPEDALQGQIQVLGYGARTGIDLEMLSPESGGRVPTPATNRALAEELWKRSPANYDNDEAKFRDAKRWKAGYSADVAIGQFDTLVTPLQNANAYASLANKDGNLFKPSLFQRSVSGTDPNMVTKVRHPELIRKIDYGPARQAMLDGFHGVTHLPNGTAFAAFQGFPAGFSVSGKTGTAEVGDDQGQKADNSLFVGYGPNPDNLYVVSVMIEGGGFGSESAAPATNMILRPIADGSLASFQVPRGGRIDAEAALERSQIKTQKVD